MLHRKLGEILVERGLITPQQLHDAIAAQDREHGRIGEVLIKLGVLSEDQVVEVVAQQFGIPQATLENGLLNPRRDQRLHAIIPYHFSKTHFILPIKKEGTHLVCAVPDPLDFLLLDNLKMLAGCEELTLYIATRDDLSQAIQDFYTSATYQQVQRLSDPVDAVIVPTKDYFQEQLKPETPGSMKSFNMKLLREDPRRFQEKLMDKGVSINLDELITLDKKRRTALTAIDDLRAQKNTGDQQIKALMSHARVRDVSQERQIIIEKMTQLSREISNMEPHLKELENKIDQILVNVPNLPHDSVPIGGEESTKLIREWGIPKQFDFVAKTHIQLAESLDMIDFKRATKVSGSNFILYKNAGARLERALINFMLDLHTAKHGYQEVFTPFLVNSSAMFGTGQLPKMKEDMYEIKSDDLYLIPTAEVPITNMHSQEILPEEELPLCYTGYTACFRREAGSYGRDTRGLVRVHQFDKVELVRFVKPEDSYVQLEDLLNHAETVLRLLELPYRVVLLATGDLSFAASKTFDLEAHAAGIDRWLEVSSCSNFEDFQARRAHIRYKGKTAKKPEFVHTLNGSGLALARTMVAIMENYQTADGGIMIPKVLQPYMGGLQKIEKQ